MDKRTRFETIRYHVEDGIGVVALDRPECLNAINRRMVAEVEAAIDAAETDAAVGAIVILGQGRAFCSGFDLKDAAAAEVDGAAGWRAILEDDFTFLTRFWHCEKPTIAAVHGYCLAGRLRNGLVLRRDDRRRGCCVR